MLRMLSCAAVAVLLALHTAAADTADQIKAVKSVGDRGAGNERAAAAWEKLSQLPVDQAFTLLEAFDGAGPLAVNYLRSAVDAIFERRRAEGKELPAKKLEEFVFNTQHDPKARRTAYEWLVKVDPAAPDRLLPKMLHDPSVEIRRDAVARQLAKAKGVKEKAKALKLYGRIFDAAVDDDQVKIAAKVLRELGREVDIAKHYGLVIRWHLIGPFDNSGETGFDKVYPPEEEIDLQAAYEGKDGQKVTWKEHITADEYGKVDLNEVMGKHKGACTYAMAFFESEKEQPVQMRLTSINAVKLWVNGELIDSREVYHAGSAFDQYIKQAMLKKGRNTILLKVCQNEQEERWAQRWFFQLRVCDPTGTAILATNRAPKPKKEEEDKKS